MFYYPTKMTDNTKKGVFSDFDGTLSGGYASMEFLDYLFSRDMYSKEKYLKQMELVQGYKNKKVTYDGWIQGWAELWAQGLHGQKEEIIDQAAKDFFKGFEKNIYGSSFEMMKHLKLNNFQLVLVSVGAYEVAALACSNLNMDYTIATKCEKKNGIYTGKLSTNLHFPTGKADAIIKYAKDNGISLSKSYAMGDSIHDASMLEIVGKPITLNASPDLKLVAENKNWPMADYNNVLEYIK